jgi:hypothetical protein
MWCEPTAILGSSGWPTMAAADERIPTNLKFSFFKIHEQEDARGG